MLTPDLTYFTCTLGEAALDGISRPFANVNQLIAVQAEQNPDLPAIGFFDTEAVVSKYTPKILTYREVRNGALAAAVRLRKMLDLQDDHATIALLADSSSAFLFTWLGAIRLGLAVLLVAPQCSAGAIANLCRACGVTVLLADGKHQDLAAEACAASSTTKSRSNEAGPAEAASKLNHKLLPFAKVDDVYEAVSSVVLEGEDLPMPSSQSKDIAYLHHTSGTSSGVPKPIPQTHHGAVGVLPALDGRDKATFTTTPLYHGGPADIFRAWSSSAMIWLFPSQAVPITPANIIKCLIATKAERDGGSQVSHDCPARYFTSVPYILQMMAADEEGLRWLQKMDLVGVGGAALPVEVGDKLVRQGVRLVSRFGSAECGFLLSSHRDYDCDTEWQYLRLNKRVAQLRFESTDDDLSELVVRSDWPHMAKRNREDGSYATSDLFAKHSNIHNAFRYHSRADSQLTLITGKKFDPAPLEDAIVAASPLISNALVFGNGKPYPGVLVFKSKDATTAEEEGLFEEVARIVENINRESQSHARIPRNMLMIMPTHNQALEKSSKGTILRSRAEERYSKHIDEAYDRVDEGMDENISDDKVQTTILNLVQSFLGPDTASDLQAGSDLFSEGIDSVACVQIRHSLSRILPNTAKSLPLTIVEDLRTVAGLTDFVLRVRRGESIGAAVGGRMEIPKLIEQFSNLEMRRESPKTAKSRQADRSASHLSVLMTGPTGSLGSHVLHTLLQTACIGKIYLLVRGATPQAARERVLKALSSRRLKIPVDFDDKVVVLQSKLSDPNLGLSEQDYALLQRSVDLVVHLAWSVNFLLSLGSFTPHFAGIQNLLRLCSSNSKQVPPKMIFCSSVASVSAFNTGQSLSSNVPEKIVPSTAASGPTGYALSKLAAELILGRAATFYPALRGRIVIIRVGQLSADTLYGVWNKSEAYPQILASSKFTSGSFPDLGEEERLTWLPVDIAAKAFVEAAMAEESTMAEIPTEYLRHKAGRRPNTKAQIECGPNHDAFEIDTAAVRVLHLANPDHKFSFTDFVVRLQNFLLQRSENSDNHEREVQHDSHLRHVKIVPVDEWLRELETLQSSSPSADTQQLLRLLPFWKQAYAGRQPSPQKYLENSRSDTSYSADTTFDMHNSLLTMPSLTYWLGKNTLEAARPQPKLMRNVIATLHNTAKSGIDVDCNGDSKYVSKVGAGTQCDTLKEAELDSEAAELLSKDYVLKTWSWISANVP